MGLGFEQQEHRELDGPTGHPQSQNHWEGPDTCTLLLLPSDDELEDERWAPEHGLQFAFIQTSSDPHLQAFCTIWTKTPSEEATAESISKALSQSKLKAKEEAPRVKSTVPPAQPLCSPCPSKARAAHHQLHLQNQLSLDGAHCWPCFLLYPVVWNVYILSEQQPCRKPHA